MHSGSGDSPRLLWAPYCGLYCVYAAARHQRTPLAFNDLVKPEYIGSRGGSAFGELQRAALDHGMDALLIGNMSADALRRLEYPIILHCSSANDAASYDHFVLFLGTRNGQLVILDPPDRIVALSEAELLSRWDGNGLIVAAHQIDKQAVLLATFVRPATIAGATAIGIIVMWILRGCRKRQETHQSLGRIALMSGVTCISILLFGTALGYSYNLLRSDGLLADSAVLIRFEEANIASLIPRLGASEVGRWKARGALVVDARYSADYEAGHMPGAISVPVNADVSLRSERLARIPLKTTLVVYCESQQCKYAESVAVRLHRIGYRDVAIYEGGWRDWQHRLEHTR